MNSTLIVSSSSDSASAQKRFNQLLEEQRRKAKEKFGAMCPAWSLIWSKRASSKDDQYNEWL